MKQGRKLTRNEKELLRNVYALKSDDWQFLDECRDEAGRPTSFSKFKIKPHQQLRSLIATEGGNNENR